MAFYIISDGELFGRHRAPRGRVEGRARDDSCRKRGVGGKSYVSHVMCVMGSSVYYFTVRSDP